MPSRKPPPPAGRRLQQPADDAALSEGMNTKVALGGRGPPPAVPKRLSLQEVVLEKPAVVQPGISTVQENSSGEEEKRKKKQEQRKVTRDKVAMEFMTTEKSYVNSLEQLEKNYIKPLKVLASTPNNAILSQDQLGGIFSNLQQIIVLNNKFLVDLEERLGKWSENPCLGDVVLQFAPFFKMYTQYVNNHETATSVLGKARTDDKKGFGDFERACMQQGGGISLDSYLILPIQRVPRYKLLLQELKKNTEPDHKDMKNIDKALEVVGTVAMHINDSVKQQERRAKIAAIQDKITGGIQLITPSRVFVKQGPLTKVCRSRDYKYEFFLFNDLLLYADNHLSKTKYKLHRQFSLDSNDFVAKALEDEEGKPAHRIQITNPQKSFIVYATSASEKEEWLTAINKVLEDTLSKRTMRRVLSQDGKIEKAPVWVKDSSSKNCQICDVKFPLGGRFAKHHCRKCGRLVCGKCSQHRLVLTFLNEGDKKQRVCNLCKKEIDRGPVLCKCRASHNWRAEEDGDLTISKGDTIEVFEKMEDGWWVGECNGKRGAFPSNYVKESEA